MPNLISDLESPEQLYLTLEFSGEGKLKIDIDPPLIHWWWKEVLTWLDQYLWPQEDSIKKMEQDSAISSQNNPKNPVFTFHNLSHRNPDGNKKLIKNMI